MIWPALVPGAKPTWISPTKRSLKNTEVLCHYVGKFAIDQIARELHAVVLLPRPRVSWPNSRISRYMTPRAGCSGSSLGKRVQSRLYSAGRLHSPNLRLRSHRLDLSHNRQANIPGNHTGRRSRRWHDVPPALGASSMDDSLCARNAAIESPILDRQLRFRKGRITATCRSTARLL